MEARPFRVAGLAYARRAYREDDHDVGRHGHRGLPEGWKPAPSAWPASRMPAGHTEKMIATWVGMLIVGLDAGSSGRFLVGGLAYPQRGYRDDDGDVSRDGHRARDLGKVKKVMLSRGLP